MTDFEYLIETVNDKQFAVYTDRSPTWFEALLRRDGDYIDGYPQDQHRTSIDGGPDRVATAHIVSYRRMA